MKIFSADEEECSSHSNTDTIPTVPKCESGQNSSLTENNEHQMKNTSGNVNNDFSQIPTPQTPNPRPESVLEPHVQATQERDNSGML